MPKKKYAAIVLSAGRGTRMNNIVPKQYLLLKGKPIIYYSLLAFEQSIVDEIVLVTGKEDVDYCQKEIIEKYNFNKVKSVIAGGKERYHSVYCGLMQLSRNQKEDIPDYVMIHDGARPFINENLICQCAKEVEKYQTCVVGIPIKDTIKIVDEELFVKETPERKFVWQIQTPQAFAFSLIYKAYKELINREKQGEIIQVTDDAMVLEMIFHEKVKLLKGFYENIKITTPDDLKIAQLFC